jgi:hypothetical protein
MSFPRANPLTLTPTLSLRERELVTTHYLTGRSEFLLPKGEG